MNGPPPPNQNEIDARTYQDKFDLYFLGLTFTILGLSIQTASFGKMVWSDCLELLAWLLLLLSGLAGLYKGLWKPNLYSLFGSKQAGHWSGDTEDKILVPLKKKIEHYIGFQKWCFVLGLVLLVLSRAFLPAMGIIKAFKS